MRNLLLFLFVLLPFFSEGQARYFVYLKDKAGSSGRIDNPSAFLSQRAIERREAQHITITERDIPVSKTYLDEIQKLGFKVIGKSKWLNAVLVDGPAAKFELLRTRSFVSGIEGNMNIRGCLSSTCIPCDSTKKPSSPSITWSKKTCDAKEATLVANGCTGIVLWSNGEYGNTIIVDKESTYYAYCTTECGSSNASSPGYVYFLTSPPPAPIVSTNKISIVGNEFATMIATGCNGSITWSNGSTDKTIHVGVGTYSATCTDPCGTSIPSTPITLSSPSSRIKSKFDSPVTPVDYGSSSNQIKMLGADTMHAAGFTGEGILIAVMDAGFPNVNTADAFAHLRSGNKIKRTYNFVENSTNVYRDNAHGTNVLSIITALLPGKLIGTAPLADVALYTTEDNNSETKQEEVYWTFAAEDADSLGVDVINTSLGYSQFDDASQNYTYEDMDGQTTIMVRAANYATQVGIIVVNSAGNEGNSTWKYISTPADGDHVIAVGAVTSGKLKAGFSSFGPSADGRIKPDVTAMGQGTILSNSGSNISSGNGTSYSGPLIAGFMAGLKQQFPTLTSLQLRELLIRSADRYYKPDNEYGYGIPSYTRAVKVAYEDYILLGNETKEELAVLTYPNPISEGETLKIKVGGNTLSENQTVNLTDNSGRIVYKQVNLKSLNLKPLSSGIYHLSFNLNQTNYSQKLVIKK